MKAEEKSKSSVSEQVDESIEDTKTNSEAQSDEAEVDSEPSSDETEYQEEPTIMESVRQFASEEKEKEFVQETVEKINSMYRHNVDNGKLEIGNYLLDEVFGGNVE